MRPIFLLLALASSHAQTVGVQLNVGVPVSGFKANDSPFRFGSVESFTNRYVAGVFGELLFGNKVGFEIGALYRRTHVAGETRSVAVYPLLSSRAAGGAWLIPISIKYRLTRSTVAPFVVAGPLLTRSGLSGDLTTINWDGGPISTTKAFRESSVAAGWSVGGGLDISAARVRVSPQLRYMHSGVLKCGACGLSSDFPALNTVYIMLGAGF